MIPTPIYLSQAMVAQLQIGKQSLFCTASLYLLQLFIKVLNTKPWETYALYPYSVLP
jgi:hypothetical protein